MDVRIGVTYAAKELTLEVEATADEVAEQVEAARANDHAFLWLTDKSGSRVGVPMDKLAYIEIEGRDRDRQVGFGKSA